MMVTAEEMRREIQNLENQRQQAYDLYQQALGALALANSMLERLESAEDKDHLTMGEFAEMIGGNGAVAEVNDV